MKSKLPNIRTEEILHSIDGMKKEIAPDFFYTRLIGRMQNRLDNNKKTVLLLRPAFLAAILSIILFVNIVSLKQQRATIQKTDTGKATIDSFADAYNLNNGTSY